MQFLCLAAGCLLQHRYIYYTRACFQKKAESLHVLFGCVSRRCFLLIWFPYSPFSVSRESTILRVFGDYSGKFLPPFLPPFFRPFVVCMWAARGVCVRACMCALRVGLMLAFHLAEAVSCFCLSCCVFQADRPCTSCWSSSPGSHKCSHAT